MCTRWVGSAGSARGPGRPGSGIAAPHESGAGLIGTSIALALTGRGIVTHLIDRDPENVRVAAARGAGAAEPPAEPVDLAVVAVPPSDIARTVRELQSRQLARAYTDVASVKAVPHAQCAAIGCDLTTLVGGRPMVGRERSGPLAAKADLFKDRPWVLTPTRETSENTLNKRSWRGHRSFPGEGPSHRGLEQVVPHMGCGYRLVGVYRLNPCWRVVRGTGVGCAHWGDCAASPDW
ncbi:hypothetical protein CRI70_16270 [Streptomyces sp. Ru87]|nr:hypothetical protein CRI70_16270 [Streptomyces sp. Ru87]